ncbi:MAG: hypothetical protein JXQ75_06815 [Phycisphaerae bacterium]|nr:hypothetical protein [Phycisphaerae bacterium]
MMIRWPATTWRYPVARYRLYLKKELEELLRHLGTGSRKRSAGGGSKKKR